MSLPPYCSIRPEERLVRITESLHTALNIAYDTLEERILLRSVLPLAKKDDRDPSTAEAEELALYEQVLKLVYFDKERTITELDQPLHQGLARAIGRLLGTLPRYHG